MKKRHLYPSLLFILFSVIVAVIFSLCVQREVVIPGARLDIVLTIFNIFVFAMAFSGYVIFLYYIKRHHYRNYVPNLVFLFYSLLLGFSLFLPLLNPHRGLEPDPLVISTDIEVFIISMLLICVVIFFAGRIALRTQMQYARIRKWKYSMRHAFEMKQKTPGNK